MMGRVTQGVMHNDFLNSLHNRTEHLQKTQKKLNTGFNVLLPSDDPANTINYMEWSRRQSDISKFNEIINSSRHKMDVVDGQLESVNNSLHRARELIVQAANGTYVKDDRIAMGIELDQIIRQMASSANAQYKGTALFAGTSHAKEPYRTSENFNELTGMPLVDKVAYFGNGQEQVMDIGRSDRITSVLAGTAIFETEKTILQGDTNVAGYIATQDSNIMIEGTEINIFSGDNLETIAQKINDAQLTIKASIETNQQGQSFFRITSISPRQPWIQDIAGSTVLQDLGLVDGGSEGIRNFAPTAVKTQASIFDTLIKVRDDLLKDDVFVIGGEDLGLVDQSMNNILRYRTYTGAVSERLAMTLERNTAESIYLKQAISDAVDTDYPTTISELKMAEFAHQVALNVGAKLLPPTLMDFLR
ncbi:MAG: flagellar hook-associated protein 3 [Brevinema sp.]